MRNVLYKFINMCLRMLYPQTCYYCGKINKTAICAVCQKKMIYVNEPRCKRCGKPVRYEEKEFCEDCRRERIFYEQGRSVWVHKDPVAWSVYQFKYHNRRVFGEFYASEMWRIHGNKISDWNIDTIVPVPLHWKRRLDRGYNQAEILAKHLGRFSKIPVQTKGMKRIRYTERQKSLGHKERKKNLTGAFVVTKKWKKARNVLVVDDIYTTGNTINEISKILRQEGVEKVFFLTISIGQGF